VSLVFSFSESSLDEVNGHLESGSLSVFVDLLGVNLRLLDQVLDQSDPFLAFVARASMASSSSAAVSTRSSAVVVSRESFLHVVGIAAHVEGVVLFVSVVSDSIHVCVCL